MRKTDQKRQHILDTAFRLFQSKGFANTSMSEITAEAGGSKATVYNYFPSKEELFAEFLLGGEVVVDGGLGAAGLGGDFGHAGVGEALALEQPVGRVEDVLSFLVGLAHVAFSFWLITAYGTVQIRLTTDVGRSAQYCTVQYSRYVKRCNGDARDSPAMWACIVGY